MKRFDAKKLKFLKKDKRVFVVYNGHITKLMSIRRIVSFKELSDVEGRADWSKFTFKWDGDDLVLSYGKKEVKRMGNGFKKHYQKIIDTRELDKTEGEVK